MLGGRYELDREIGRGGMGAVWHAHDTVLGRDVAVKQIGMAAGGTEPDLERAEREAHLAASINHQNVVAVYDLVDEDGYQWLVMEHVDGPTLSALIAERGSIPAAELAPIAEQVARALAAAHSLGIVHRDVKPSNILLTSDGTAKLSDFGVARAQADASLTQTGMVTGSPAYISPEVASGRPATSASDVWSLGATLFHALSGRTPYEVGDNLLGTMYRIVNEEPPRLEGTGGLVALVAEMMQHDPDVRPTMAAIETAAGAQPAEHIDVDPESTQAFVAFSDETAATAPVPTPLPTPAPSATTAFRPLAPPVTEVAATTPPPPPPPATAAAPARSAATAVPRAPTNSHRDTASSRSRTPWYAAAAAAVVVLVIAFLVLGGGDEDPADDLPAAGDGTQSSAPADPSASPDEAVDGVTAAALEGFAADYLMTAASDPDTGFTMLTPEFQRESNGIEGYKGFWDKVSGLDVENVQGDPADMRVSYTYSYEFEGERRTDSVTLQLEKSGDTFLIAGET